MVRDVFSLLYQQNWRNESYAGEINISQRKTKGNFPIEIKRPTYSALQRYSLPTKKNVKIEAKFFKTN